MKIADLLICLFSDFPICLFLIIASKSRERNGDGALRLVDALWAWAGVRVS